MDFFNKIFGRMLLILQFILVFLFIVFEEIIWEGIAKPIYNKIESLKITQKLEVKIQDTDRYVVLAVFSSLLLAVEAAGLLAGVFFLQGQILVGLLLYVAKIPIAAFVFWLFKAGKEKLLSFDWFNWSYKKIMAGLDWLKERESYKRMMIYMLEVKSKIKENWKVVKFKYFAEEGSFMKELKNFYAYMKNFKNNIKKDNKKDDSKEEDMAND